MAIDKVVDSTILDGYFEDIADAIRAKAGTQGSMTPANMPQAIADIPSGGGDEALLALLAGTATGAVTVGDLEDLGLTSIKFIDYSSGSTTIRSNAGVTSLTLSDLVNAEIRTNLQTTNFGGILGANLYSGSTHVALTEINLPEAKSISIQDSNGYTFGNLEEINAPKLTQCYIELKSSKVETLSFPALITFRGSLNTSSYLTTINLPECTSLNGTFGNNTALVNVNLPKVTSFNNSLFYNCTALERVVLPKANPYGTGMFYGCTSLEYVEFGNSYGGGAVNNNAFYNCSSLTAIVFRGSRVVHSLSNTSALTGTPIASGTGYIYVPDSIKATYKTATNWATYANQFRSLEDYTVDGTVTGELDPTKI